MTSAHNSEQYLAQSVLNASPARLRLMLIERGLQLASSLAAMPPESLDPVAFSDQTLRLRDILGELLSGVAVGETEVAKQVSDLYVFLLQHLTAAEQQHDPVSWREIATVLEIERETWQLACAQTSAPAAAAAATADPAGNAAAPAAKVPLAKIPLVKVPAPHADMGSASPRSSSLNLEA
ncbi:flagellar export chaperone FliS [Roseimaritima ulvae]|uniref:Flagellar protein FliS n=1 Tax=Roseimaritima ulvae TaxID=980254 RepID=A0A5B9QPW3_9BACT|nr:flagellar export chaperone FliS [Roseimaritima ulvae]QEG39710.1 flagellar protein FliS [Roseimaritima ulvae]